MLFSGSITSQTILRQDNDRLLIVDANGDTLFVYGQNSHFVIEKTIIEQGLLISEVLRQYELIDSLLSSRDQLRSLVFEEKRKSELTSTQLDISSERLAQCEDINREAESLVTELRADKHQLERTIKKNKVMNRLRSLIEGLSLAAIIYIIAI